MEANSMGNFFLKELEAETLSTRKCLERIPLKLYDYKPHETSMAMGYLTLLVAEMPNWISRMILDSEIDLATYGRFEPKDTEDLVAHFDKNIEGAKKALVEVSDETLADTFSLKRNGQLLYSSPKLENISSTLNHWVHHRGQLTVYMRLNDIAIPSIYGPSADDKGF